jgi:ABC-type transport system involved in cytochrome c biogenesis permease component
MRLFLLLIKKDLTIIARGYLLLIFSWPLLFILISAMAFSYPGQSVQERIVIGNGILWLSFVFSVITVFSISTQYERENRAILGVVLSSPNSSLIYLSKFFSNALISAVLLFALVLLLNLFWTSFNFSILSFYPILILLSFSVSSIGTILSFLATLSRSRELIFPVIFLPLILAPLGAAISASNQLMQGENPFFWELFLIFFSFTFCGISILLFPLLIKE